MKRPAPSSLFNVALATSIYLMWAQNERGWCQDPTPSGSHSSQDGQAQSRPEAQRVTSRTDTFDGSKALSDLSSLLELGNRYYGAPKREQAIEHLLKGLRSSGMEVARQDFNQVEPRSGKSYVLTNLIGRFEPSRHHRVLLGSHWDTRLWAEEDADPARQHHPITGANDGSSGLVVLNEIARRLPQLGLTTIGIDLVFFDGEEFGRPGSNDYCAGSKYFAAHLRDYYPQAPPVAVIILDMVGDADLSFPPERSSAVKARALTSLIWSEGVRLGLPAFINGLGKDLGPKPPPISRWIVDDHTPFQALNIPATLIIDLDYPYWHTHQDTLDKVSASSLKQTGDVLVASLQRLDQLVK